MMNTFYDCVIMFLINAESIALKYISSYWIGEIANFVVKSFLAASCTHVHTYTCYFVISNHCLSTFHLNLSFHSHTPSLESYFPEVSALRCRHDKVLVDCLMTARDVQQNTTL